MSETPPARIFPFLRYQDAPAAFEWLTRAFGFEKQMLVPGPEGTIAHAQLRYGSSLIMIASVGDEEKLIQISSARDDEMNLIGTASARDDAMKLKRPAVVGGAAQGIYVLVDDVTAHHDRAKAAGAEIIMELEDTDYGSREYMARDLEGHLWSFGTYAPDVTTDGK